MMPFVRRFCLFWYDFIVGDSIVLAVGGLAVLLIGWALVQAGAATVAQFALPAVVIATLIASLTPRRR